MSSKAPPPPADVLGWTKGYWATNTSRSYDRKRALKYLNSCISIYLLTPLYLMGLSQNGFGTLHGGAIGIFIDALGSLAIASNGPAYAAHVSVDINTTFIAGANLGEILELEGVVDKLGKSLAFTSVSVKVGNKVVALGRHTKFMMPPPKL
ncbi:hypothetical protein SmJEL517_g03908 [Synchytrium microbalum]|uniref:Thioesterase domain-containing protein n=1 Tax=Synchytrium microbalum TaxID=1806994 RepID=A0A507C699_9FUNG|nr:uncharacterized protein SmJEL517_g03908 [Synchytrium microbalum]TPX33073.1 hypothetical protein SmJEL517_g03908 [Synchytrium microbalum]